MTQALMTTHDPEAYKAEQSAKLARMAGQIADFFVSYPEDQAIVSIATHINEFWSRKMREDFVAAFNEASPELRPLVAKALPKIKATRSQG
jgi:formate dehydrogenase subunit delta